MLLLFSPGKNKFILLSAYDKEYAARTEINFAMDHPAVAALTHTLNSPSTIREPALIGGITRTGKEV
ncbi:MAG: hypothetical protein ACOYEH_05090 [Caldicoprobacterales bacterium]|jgi:hypothetical protein|nr:hypothetical protein [Clostridiales bacterium]